MSFGLSLDALAGSGVTEDEESTATSGSDEAVKSGAVMERLIHDTGPFPGRCCGLLHPHQSADISDPTKMHKHNTKTVILTARCHFISVLEVTKLSYFIFLFQVFLFNPKMPPSPAPPQKICIKCTAIKNQKSAVIALFEITIIKIKHLLNLKLYFIHVSSVLAESL